MTSRKREGNRPDRRLMPDGGTAIEFREALTAKLRYVGSANHKLCPGNYGFVPTQNPRPSKSPCDDLRQILLEEASRLFRLGIKLGMFSHVAENGIPKYVWAVDEDDQVYEAKCKSDREVDFHGYRIGDDERGMQNYILKEWKRRCQ